MTTNLNPQAEQMADESMVRNLAAQAEAIWPQEWPLFARYPLPSSPRILDAGCGTGEITRRLAAVFPRAEILGVDVIGAHLKRARDAASEAGLDRRVHFEEQSVYALDLPDDAFDLIVCRHVLHAIPQTREVLEELRRVLRPGGWIHLLVEDYGMIHFEPRELDSDAFWQVAPVKFGAATGTDLHVGRRTPRLLRELGFTRLTVDYAVVDTVRVPRATFAAIWQAWRDGYADAIAATTPFSRDEVLAHFDDMLATIRDPNGFGAWISPIVAGQLPSDCAVSSA